MSKTVTTDDGTEVELSDDIIGEIESEAVEKFRAENPDVDKIDDYKSELEEARAKLVEIEEKQKKDTTGQNMGELRKAREDADKRAKDAEERLGKEVAEVKGQIAQRDKEEALRDIVGDNAELRKEVLEHYDKTLSAMAVTTPEEVRVRMKAALKLAKPDATPSIMGHEQISSGGGSFKPAKESTPDPEFAAKMGLTEERIKQLKPDVERMRAERERNG